MKFTRNHPPRLRAKAVFVDLEYTLIRYTRTTKTNPTKKIQTLLADAMVRQLKVDRAKAMRRVQAIPEDQLLTPGVGMRLGIDDSEIRPGLQEWLSTRIEGDADAKTTLEAFRRSGLKLWTATTNIGYLGALKLETVGLGRDADGNPLFEEICGGTEVHPCGKLTSGFFTNLLQRADLAPDDVVHIGDSHIWDCDVPRAAGIRKIILIDRSLSERFVEGSNGEIYARNWAVIRHLVEAA